LQTRTEFGSSNGHISQFCEEVAKRNSKSFRDYFDIAEGQVSPATLNAADVGAIQMAFVSKRLLRQSSGLPKGTESPAVADEDVGSLHHATMVTS
jgi:hypothetical protein